MHRSGVCLSVCLSVPSTTLAKSHSRIMRGFLRKVIHKMVHQVAASTQQVHVPDLYSTNVRLLLKVRSRRAATVLN